MNKQKKVRKHTFTLVELLVVLLILGVLVGLAVPRYMDVQKSARLRSFAANTREIESALETYRLSNSTEGNKYPDNLSELQGNFTQQPINPYTGKSMLSDNPEESGLRYENHGNDYTLCVTQLDIDDVNNNGNRNESIPVASHCSVVGEACSVVTGTEPYKVLEELFFRDDPNKEFVNLAMMTSPSECLEHGIECPYGAGIMLDRTFIGTTTITIDPTNGLSAFQTRGDVSNNGNYMICASNCEATTIDTFMIYSNNADDSVIEFTVNIPEIETGRIEIGLTDFYLRYDSGSDEMYLYKDGGKCIFEDVGGYTGTHTFRFEFHHGLVGIKMDNQVLVPAHLENGHSFNVNGRKFFVKNINTNAAVQIGTIAITIDKYEFATTGTYISSIYNICTPNFITGTTAAMVISYDFAQLEQHTDFTLEYQLSLNGGATWGDWQPVALYENDSYGDGMYESVSSDFLRNISLENARIRLRVTLSTNNTKFSPEIGGVTFILANALAQP